MAQNVLNVHGNVVPRCSVCWLTQTEENSEVEKSKRAEFTKIITSKLGNLLYIPLSSDPCKDGTDSGEGGENSLKCLLEEDANYEVNEETTFEHSLHDSLIHAEVLLPHNDEMRKGIVKGRHANINGEVIGQFDVNPLLNNMIYDAEFADGTIKEYAANVIAQNIYAAMSDDWKCRQVIKSILDHRTDQDALPKLKKYIICKTGRRRMRKTTIGWSILVKWKNGEEQWVPLRMMKLNYPIEMVKYAVSREISGEPAFCWWVRFTLMKRDAIVSSIHARIAKSNYKYGIKIPKIFKEALTLDAENGNSLWRDSIDLEMNTILTAFDILSYGEKVSPGYVQSSGHIIFDMKMDFTCVGLRIGIWQGTQ